jgi:DNA-binding transcriptional ArsR family regulator
VIDEYAELAGLVPGAAADTDTIARLGRAVAVTLIAATQRPTQQAMGQRAVRSQMDVRIAFRVRERRDSDLILGPGMLAAGWHAHTLNAPGKFLISAPEHDTPRRGRAYLLTDDMVTATAARHASARPELDEISAQAIVGSVGEDLATPADDWPEPVPNGDVDTPEVVLWAVLSAAPPDGVAIGDLMAETGISRPTLYRRLAELTQAGLVTQVSRGRWTAAAGTTGSHDA